MTAKEFTLGALDKPVVNLGDIGTFTLGDITKSRRAAMEHHLADVEALSEASTELEAVRAICQLVETSCENGSGIAEKLTALYESDSLGFKEIMGLGRFVGEWFQDIVDQGNG